MSFLIRHLLESTLFCLLLSSLACCIRKGATARYAVWLIGISKFAIPSVLLASTGAQLALLWHAASWLSSSPNGFSAALFIIFGVLRSSIERENAIAHPGTFIIWAFGTTAMLSIWFVRLRSANRYHCLTLPTLDEQDAMLRARSLLRVGADVQFRSSDAASEPALRGLWHPTVTVPRGLSQKLTSAELRAVLLHELAHARRRDNLTAVFVHALLCLFWFHPLLWFIERLLNVERERACDELVIACGTTPQVYAASLLKVCKFHLFEVAPGFSHMTGSDLERRLGLILQHPVSAPLSRVPRLLIASLSVLMTVFPVAGGYCGECISDGEGQTASHVLEVSPCQATTSHVRRSQPDQSCIEEQ